MADEEDFLNYEVPSQDDSIEIIDPHADVQVPSTSGIPEDAPQQDPPSQTASQPPPPPRVKIQREVNKDPFAEKKNFLELWGKTSTAKLLRTDQQPQEPNTNTDTNSKPRNFVRYSEKYSKQLNKQVQKQQQMNGGPAHSQSPQRKIIFSEAINESLLPNKKPQQPPPVDESIGNFLQGSQMDHIGREREVGPDDESCENEEQIEQQFLRRMKKRVERGRPPQYKQQQKLEQKNILLMRSLELDQKEIEEKERTIAILNETIRMIQRHLQKKQKVTYG